METITAGGLRMPKLGLGTWQMRGEECTAAVLSALALGYRHIDTAERYGNEAEVGEALTATDVPRGDIHVTTKLAREILDPAAIEGAVAASLRKLRTDYVDLYMLHWPTTGMDLAGIMAALLRLREQGMIREIGVCNFTVAWLRRAIEEVQAPVVCNQVEYHVLLDQSKLLAYAREKGIPITAYCPLARGGLDQYPTLAEIARKHGASAQQVALKYLLDQDGVAAIPKATRTANQQANLDAWGLELDDEDRAVIAALPKDYRIANGAHAPVWDT